uniref:Uncharacterized protein n=1 Tax=Sphaerodactylus townsendi TaxID=933632 RepID=A0ACB8EJT1_9SAUR
MNSILMEQGSSSVSGSPVLSTSGTSTPRRGRRQLPQTPSTPRPHISYSPVVRKAVNTQAAHPSRLVSPAPRRYPSLPAEHHASERRSRSPALERHTVPPRNDSPRAYRHASSRWSAPHVSEPHPGPRHGGGSGGYYRSPDYAAPAGEEVCPYETVQHGSSSGRSPRTSRVGGGGGSCSLSPSRHGRRLPNGYYPSHGPAKARGTSSRQGLHEPYSETDEDDCC